MSKRNPYMDDDDDDDGPRRIRQSTDGDFEGGVWGDDGEFYATGIRRGRTLTKEQQILGIWADDDEEEYERRGGIGVSGISHGGAGGGAAMVTGGVAFVSSGIFNPNQDKERAPPDDAAMEPPPDNVQDGGDVDMDDARPGLGAGGGGGGGVGGVGAGRGAGGGGGGRSRGGIGTASAANAAARFAAKRQEREKADADRKGGVRAPGKDTEERKSVRVSADYGKFNEMSNGMAARYMAKYGHKEKKSKKRAAAVDGDGDAHPCDVDVNSEACQAAAAAAAAAVGEPVDDDAAAAAPPPKAKAKKAAKPAAAAAPAKAKPAAAATADATAASPAAAAVDATVGGAEDAAARAAKWAEWRKRATDALDAYRDCGDACYDDIVARQFIPWNRTAAPPSMPASAYRDVPSTPGFTAAQFEEARTRVNMIHYQIIGNKLYRSHACWFPMRCDGIEHFIEKAIARYTLPDMEFIVNVGDWPQVHAFPGAARWPIMSFSKNGEYRDIMYPAWAFWAGGPCVKSEPKCLGRWDIKRKNMIGSVPWERKQPVAFFVGGRTDESRDRLIDLSRRRPDLINAKYTKEWNGMPAAPEVKLEDHCQYRILLNMRGVAASFRHRHLFLCGSLVLHAEERPTDWLEFYYEALVPWVHYIPIRNDFSDAQRVLEFVHDNEDIARRIADAGHEWVVRHLRMQDVTKYWYDLLRAYQKLITWPVKKHPATEPTPIAWD